MLLHQSTFLCVQTMQGDRIRYRRGDSVSPSELDVVHYFLVSAHFEHLFKVHEETEDEDFQQF